MGEKVLNIDRMVFVKYTDMYVNAKEYTDDQCHIERHCHGL